MALLRSQWVLRRPLESYLDTSLVNKILFSSLMILLGIKEKNNYNKGKPSKQ